MITARVLTPYTGSGSPLDLYRPLIVDAYPLDSWQDVTRTPAQSLIPAVNLLVVQVSCTPETLAAIEADSRFSVLWQEVAP